MRTTPFLRHTLWGATTLTMATMVTTLSVPTASAELQGHPAGVWDCSTSPCTEPSTFVVGHTYSFDPGSAGGTTSWEYQYTSLNFYDDGKCLGSVSLPTNGPTSVPWVPATTGTHKLTIAYNTIVPLLIAQPTTLSVSVVAAPAGSPVAPQPPVSGNCAMTGSGTGSADPLGSGSARLLNTGNSGS
ncbi:hypothetical protein ACFXHA_29435 [Nocardia sp. NPDC059240]|uniref:hypothetical protein n=1 Tax=Nocardia sp. NPDC059240 TaxID=3346786 RepID=UPI0036A57301